MRHVTLTLPTMHIILEISSHGSGEGWRTLGIFRLGCAVVVVQVNFAILCWTEPPNKLLPIPGQSHFFIETSEVDAFFAIIF